MWKKWLQLRLDDMNKLYIVSKGERESCDKPKVFVFSNYRQQELDCAVLVTAIITVWNVKMIYS